MFIYDDCKIAKSIIEPNYLMEKYTQKIKSLCMLFHDKLK